MENDVLSAFSGKKEGRNTYFNQVQNVAAEYWIYPPIIWLEYQRFVSVN